MSPACVCRRATVSTVEPLSQHRRAAVGKLGYEGIVSKRKDSAYRSGRSPDWLKMKNANAPAVKREAEEDWGK